LRHLPEEGAGGRRKEPEEGGRSSEEGGRSFEEGGRGSEEGGRSSEEGGRSFEEGGRSFEEGGRSFEAQASGRGRRQEGASLSWPGISFFSIAPSSFLQLLPPASKLLPEAGASEAAGRSFEEGGRSCRQELNTAGRKQEATLALPLYGWPMVGNWSFF
jgi:hypothetical protein